MISRLSMFACMFYLLFAIVGIVLSVLHISTVSKSGAATTGIVLSCLAIVIGSVRLFIGAGIF